MKNLLILLIHILCHPYARDSLKHLLLFSPLVYCPNKSKLQKQTQKYYKVL